MNLPIFGIAGNFAGHMHAAGESSELESMPEGVFAIYLPEASNYLGVQPADSEVIHYPDTGNKLQSEVELLLKLELSYKNSHLNKAEVRGFSVCDDVSIRQGNTSKLSPRKNWGGNSMFIQPNLIPLSPGDFPRRLEDTHLESTLKRKGQEYEYGLRSRVGDYMLFGETLLDWFIETVKEQTETSKFSPLNQYFENNMPASILVAVGGTNYTKFGETNYLRPGDTMVIKLSGKDFEIKGQYQIKQ